MAKAKGLLVGTVSPGELREQTCICSWAVPFRRLRGPEDPRYFCTLSGRLHLTSAFFARGGGLWHAVAFLRMVLRHATRTLFSFQGTETSVPELSRLSLSIRRWSTQQLSTLPITPHKEGLAYPMLERQGLAQARLVIATLL